MSTPLSQFPKPDALKYINKRKLFLIPNFAFGPNLPEEGEKILKKGVVCDWRKPDVIRVAPHPLFNRYTEVYDFVKLLKQSLSE